MIFGRYLVIFSQFQAFQVISECSRMVPERPRPFSERSGAVEVRKSQNFLKQIVDQFFFGQKIICWGSSETVFAGFPGHGGPILNGKRSFKVTPPPSEARSERSEVVRTYGYGFRPWWNLTLPGWNSVPGGAPAPPGPTPFVSAFGDTAESVAVAATVSAATCDILHAYKQTPSSTYVRIHKSTGLLGLPSNPPGSPTLFTSHGYAQTNERMKNMVSRN